MYSVKGRQSTFESGERALEEGGCFGETLTGDLQWKWVRGSHVGELWKGVRTGVGVAGRKVCT